MSAPSQAVCGIPVVDDLPGQGERGCSRWVLYGGVAGALVLMVFLLTSAQFMERGLEVLVLRARQRVVERLPLDLTAAERRRTLRNLDRLVDSIHGAGDRHPLMSGFLSRASAALRDDRLTAAEVEGINLFLEGREPPAGPTPEPEATATGKRG